MKNKLFIVTLEPIEQRYTKQWYYYFKHKFSFHFDVEYIDGDYIDDKIESGCFLDINKTNIYKSQQIVKIAKMFQCKKINDNDLFLFMDAWHYGITALKYMAQLNKINIKIFGFWHAGTYDCFDFISQAGLNKWASFNEAGWFKALDGSFVATNFHKKLILDYFGKDVQHKKIHVVGFPMDWQEEINSRVKEYKEKENIIVFPHRLDYEKQPEVFDKLSKEFPNYKFIKTLEITKNKKEYYELLQKAKFVFSASLQETFGIGTVEAMFLDCVPLVPDRLSYVELYDKSFRYENKNFNDCVKKLYDMILHYNEYLVKLKENKTKIKRESLGAILRMVEVMKR